MTLRLRRFPVWTHTPHRPTKDLDLPGRGDPSLEHCQEVIRHCRISVDNDGLIFYAKTVSVFSAATVSVEKIKEDQDYESVRIKFLARLDNARIPVQVDVGFCDSAPIPQFPPANPWYLCC